QAKTATLRVETTRGADAEHRRTACTVRFGAPIKGAGTGVYKSLSTTEPIVDTDAAIEEFLEWYRWTETATTPATGRLPVVLAPEAAFLLVIPLCAGLSGVAVARETSPIFDRMGEPVLGDRLTVHDEATLHGSPVSRRFDDEGNACASRPLIENGILRGWLCDQYAAAKLGCDSTGNGFKRGLFQSGTEAPVSPWPAHVTIDGGERGARELISEIEEGILLVGGMGFHSGNFPQGQFAVQAVGFRITGGKIVGRLERTMVAGNIYQDFLDVEASRERHEVDVLGGPILAPYLRVEALDVAGAS
ncbi:MAG: TldD/PmbA family protein, partial [Candidatus Bipolaricaulota bacterium]